MKKVIITVLIILLTIGCGYLIYDNYQKSNIPDLVKVDGIYYTLTEEPSSEEEIIEKIGKVKKEISSRKIPEKKFGL
ncbi:hypothetical protein MFLO_02708 [Listeria floridensis FSL S10-1187]|uniref:Lipoprotein n=1 Tax=Listeria floridensis FSL S10-1187 TaxID=1265817 RepID=A0ABN0RHU5_9LIST|nr:hypothetical protein [Listeria floridensis]EUJ33426.1 hypothetical protein MFLO_02708 [Listeria floridensis FSL S10-1187]